jgi:predicted NUDIX family NTP pyrophosphohydrolase
MAAVPKHSAGLLLFRRHRGLEVLLVHPGGPFWAKKDEGAWSVPKGEIEPGDDARAVAAREFEEELGLAPPADDRWLDLGEVTQAGGKHVRCWAAEGDLDPAAVVSNVFEIEWPPRSGRRASFPEVDRAAWWDPDAAARLLVPAQRALVERLVAAVGPEGSAARG